MDNKRIIERVMGEMLVAGKSYHSELPSELSDWYCYTLDGGHSILCLRAEDLAESFAPDVMTTDYLIPVPVKAVLRDGHVIVNEFVVVTPPCDSNIGLITEPEDDEF